MMTAILVKSKKYFGNIEVGSKIRSETGQILFIPK